MLTLMLGELVEISWHYWVLLDVSSIPIYLIGEAALSSCHVLLNHASTVLSIPPVTATHAQVLSNPAVAAAAAAAVPVAVLARGPDSNSDSYVDPSPGPLGSSRRGSVPLEFPHFHPDLTPYP